MSAQNIRGAGAQGHPLLSLRPDRFPTQASAPFGKGRQPASGMVGKQVTVILKMTVTSLKKRSPRAEKPGLRHSGL